MINKKYVERKIFTSDVSKGLDMKGKKVINVADPPSITDEAIKGMLVQKQAIILKPMILE